MLLETLPNGLEDADALLKRREKALKRKELSRSIHTECYRYAMPSRETFNEYAEGQEKATILYDSTLQSLTYEAANTMEALLFPPWKHWCELAPGGAVPKTNVPVEILEGFQKATEVFFDYLNDSNFSTVANEAALDFLVGTGGVQFDEGESSDKPFMFSSLPLSAVELEEGPDGTIENKFMCRKPPARHLTRMYRGLQEFDLSVETQEALKQDKEVEIIQCEIYDPKSKDYYGVVIERAARKIIWRWNYGPSCPSIVARASKIPGELYGRGRIMLALADARTLNKMEEFLLRQAAFQVAPPYTAVSDGVMNPYTVTLQPGVTIPVASNDRASPSLQVLEVGGNFNVSDKIIESKRERVRRVMLGPEMGMTTGQPLSAAEVTLADRNRLWALNGEFGRIQVEFLFKVVARGIFILQKKGLIPQFKIDGRVATVRFSSPFAKSQNSEDLMAFQNMLTTIAPLGQAILALGIRTEDAPEWVSRKAGVDLSLVRPREERDQKTKEAAEAAKTAVDAGADPAEVAGMAMQ